MRNPKKSKLPDANKEVQKKARHINDVGISLLLISVYFGAGFLASWAIWFIIGAHIMHAAGGITVDVTDKTKKTAANVAGKIKMFGSRIR